MKKWHNYIVGCAVGNLIEWYDFILFGFLASLFAKLFFPNHSPFVSLLLTFMVFASGCIIRPLSGIFFGHFGDRFGRKKALVFSICLITITTTLMGLLPTYQTVGVWAPILLVACRLLQGISVSGEEIGAVILLAESAPKKQQALVGSIVLSSVYGGLFLGAITVLGLHLFMSNTAFEVWGWRLPFLAASVLGVFALKIRLRALESYEFEKLTADHGVLKQPVLTVIKNHWKNTLRVVGLCAVFAVGIYLFAVYLPSFFTKAVGFSALDSLLISSGFLFIIAVACPIVGLLADKYGIEYFMQAGCFGFLVCSYPIFYLLSLGTIAGAIAAEILLVLCLASIAGSVLTLTVRLFPTAVRYSGACIGFNISMTVFGSTAPIIALSLQNALDSDVAPALYLFVTALFSLVALNPGTLAVLALPVKFLSDQVKGGFNA